MFGNDLPSVIYAVLKVTKKYLNQIGHKACFRYYRSDEKNILYGGKDLIALTPSLEKDANWFR